VKNSLRARRMQAGLTQAELAAALGVSRQTVISIENGRYLPSLPLAFRIARLFEVPLEHVFELTEEDGR
jgi:putative transcriptional regulator